MRGKMGFRFYKGWGLALGLAAAGSAQAHTGHQVTGFVSGLEHPFGLDHLLAMVAVGFWSAVQLRARDMWQGPALFMACLLGGAAVGMLGGAMPQGELLIALSVVALGSMLVAAGRLPTAAGFALIALSASLHGVAHGAEAPGAAYVSYAAGFMLSTAALHVAGTLAGGYARYRLPAAAAWLVRGAGVACAGTGLYLATQL